jgi:HEAT repeat protein
MGHYKDIRMIKLNRFSWCVVLAAGAVLGTVFGQGAAVDQPGGEREQKLIAVLKSEAAAADKAMACKQLAIYGTKEAVASLSPLLSDEQLASWCRIAMEAIPDEACDVALREAAGRLQGRLLIGTINSLGVRRDSEAVAILAGRLKDSDADVVTAAAAALGRIGSKQAGDVLGQSLANSGSRDRAAVAHGCILCAGRFLEDGKSGEAMKLYDAVGGVDVPAQTILEATRGSILSRGSGGVVLLISQLKSEDKGRLGIGLRTARELAGQDVTEALAAELGRLSPDRQGLLLLAIADRSDAAVLPAVVKAAGPGIAGQLRMTAVTILERVGDVSCVPVLLEAAAGGDAELSARAKLSLSRLSGDGVDEALIARLPQAKGRMRQALIELAGERQIEGALAAVLQSTEDADAGVRAAAVEAVGVLGGAKEAGVLVRLLTGAQSAEEKAGIEKALRGVSGRSGTACTEHVLPLMKGTDGAVRVIGLHVLAIAGGAEALGAVVLATADKDEGVQDEAVRTLSTWPNNWPNDAGAAGPLLNLAKSGRKESHQVLGMRGYLQYVRSAGNMEGAEKVSRVGELLPLIKRAEEKRLAIAALGQIPAAGSVEMLTKLVEDPAVGEEACLAMANLGGQDIEGLSADQRRKMLETVIEKSGNEATKKKAAEALKRIR